MRGVGVLLFFCLELNRSQLIPEIEGVYIKQKPLCQLLHIMQGRATHPPETPKWRGSTTCHWIWKSEMGMKWTNAHYHVAPLTWNLRHGNEEHNPSLTMEFRNETWVHDPSVTLKPKNEKKATASLVENQECKRKKLPLMNWWFTNEWAVYNTIVSCNTEK